MKRIYFNLLFLVFLAMPVMGMANTSTINGVVEFISKEKALKLQGQIFVRVYKDVEGKYRVPETKIEKKYKEAIPMTFSISNLKSENWKTNYYLRAEFIGEEPLDDNPRYAFGPLRKKSFLVGPVKGTEKLHLILMD